MIVAYFLIQKANYNYNYFDIFLFVVTSEGTKQRTGTTVRAVSLDKPRPEYSFVFITVYVFLHRNSVIISLIRIVCSWKSRWLVFRCTYTSVEPVVHVSEQKQK